MKCKICGKETTMLFGGNCIQCRDNEIFKGVNKKISKLKARIERLEAALGKCCFVFRWCDDRYRSLLEDKEK